MHPDPWKILTFNEALKEAESCAVRHSGWWAVAYDHKDKCYYRGRAHNMHGHQIEILGEVKYDLPGPVVYDIKMKETMEKMDTVRNETDRAVQKHLIDMARSSRKKAVDHMEGCSRDFDALLIYIHEYISFQRAADMVAGYIDLNTGKYKP